MNWKNESAQSPQSRIARMWRVFVDWDQAINTNPLEIMLGSLEQRVSKLEQKVWHSEDRSAQRKGSTQ
jgi:succinyl-CoA synthetase beta subunit